MFHDKKKVILHVVYSMDLGGIENWLMSLYRAMDRNSFQFHFLVNTSKEGYFDKEIKSMGGKVFYAGRLKEPIRFYKYVCELLRTGNYSAVHVHNLEGAALALKAALNSKIAIRCFHAHTNYSEKIRSVSLLYKLYLIANRYFVARYANQFFAVSDVAGKSVYSDNPYQLIPLGIDADNYKPSSEYKVSKADFGIGPDNYVVGHVGRFHKLKNQLFFVEVAKNLLAIDRKYRFMFVGIGDTLECVREAIKAAKLDAYFVFAGLREDVPEIMLNVFDAFMFPSIYEGFGLVVVEAQAAGLPVVCSSSVPKAVVINPDIVQQLDLSCSAKQWASSAHDFFLKHEKNKRGSAYQIFCASNYNLSHTKSKWTDLWT